MKTLTQNKSIINVRTTDLKIRERNARSRMRLRMQYRNYLTFIKRESLSDEHKTN